MRTIKSVLIVTRMGCVGGGLHFVSGFVTVKWGKPHKYRRGIRDLHGNGAQRHFCNGQTLPILWNEMQNNGNASKSVNYGKD